MTYWVDNFPASKRPCVPIEPFAQLQEGRAGGIEAGLVVVGQFECDLSSGADGKLVLKRVHLLEIRWVVRVDQDAQGNGHEGRRGPSDLILTGVMVHVGHVVILVENHDGQIAIAGVGYGYCRPRRDVYDGKAVKGVAVHADHRLLVQGRRLAVVPPAIDASRPSLNGAEHAIRFRSDEVVHVHLDGRHELEIKATLVVSDNGR